MGDMSGIGESVAPKSLAGSQVLEMAKALGLTEDAQVLAKEIAGLLSQQPSLRVCTLGSQQPKGETGSTQGATGVPALDNPDDALQKEADLERLISFLQLETDKNQAALAQERIELQKGELGRRHEAQIAKLKESLEEMDKAARTNLFMKIFGWAMAAVAVAIAVTACVATGGFAAGAVVGAIVAVGMCILNETGALDSITEKLTEALQNSGMSEESARVLSSVIVAAAIVALTLGAGLGAGAVQGLCTAGAEAATTSLMATAKAVQTGLQIAAGVMGVGGAVAGGVAAYQNYKAGMLKADTTEMEKFLAVMRQQLEESQEELEAILSKIQSVYSGIATIINSEIDAEGEIARQLGRMA